MNIAISADTHMLLERQKFPDKSSYFKDIGINTVVLLVITNRWNSHVIVNFIIKLFFI